LLGCHARALWPNGASWAYSYYGTLIGNPTPGIQWYNFRPPEVTPNRGIPPVRRFLSKYFDLLFYISILTVSVYENILYVSAGYLCLAVLLSL